MKKIFFRQLDVEITRRCQLKCAHCLRGDAQNVDISNKIIDSFLGQVAGIGRLFFTGGEPTLAVDRMQYILNSLIRQGIPLYSIGFVTNGYETPSNLAVFLKDGLEYITWCIKNNPIFDDDPVLAQSPKIWVGISVDEYHDNTTDIDYKKAREWYCRQLSIVDGCAVTYKYCRVPYKRGRGKDLEFAYNDAGRDNRVMAIGLATPEHRIICDDFTHSPGIWKHCDAFVPCHIYMTAKGALLGAGSVGEFIDMDSSPSIVHFDNNGYPDICEAITRYNLGKTPCFSMIGTHGIITEHNFQIAIEQYSHKYRHVINTDLYDQERANIALAAWPEVIKTDMSKLDACKLLYESQRTKYLLSRVMKYDSKDEFEKDFPTHNSLFYRDFLAQKAACDSLSCDEAGSKLAKWILDNSTKTKYWIEESMLECGLKTGSIDKFVEEKNLEIEKAKIHGCMKKWRNKNK